MATAVRAFIQLFADDSELKKSFGALPGMAQKAGTEAGASFAKGINQAVTAARATNVMPLQLQRVGGREVDATGSPFSTGFQRFKQARELADIQGGGVGDSVASLQKLAGGTKDVTEGFKGARTAARLFGVTIASEVSPGFGEFVSASVQGAQSLGAFGAALGATLAAASLYVQRLKDATDFQVKFATAVASGDPGAAEALFKASSEGLERLKQLQKEAAAGPGAFGGPPPFQAFFANLQLLFGAGIDELRARARASAGLVAKDFAESIAPQQLLQAQAARLKLLTQGLGLERQSAESADALRVSTEQLIQARQALGETDAKLIERERLPIVKALGDALAKVGDDSKAAADVEAVAKGKLADVDRRAADVRKQAALEISQLRRDGVREAGASAAAEIEATEKIRVTVSQRRDAIVGAARAILESEATTNASLDAVFSARRQLEDAATRSTLQDLAQETAARRDAARDRLAGSPVALERELTQITQEETTKRTQILAQSMGQSIQLAQRERQERITQAEQVFAIARTLNQRRLQDDLNTQAAIAQAAQQGSQVQIAALQKVAEIQAQLQNQARAAITQGISILQQQSQRLGLEGPAFVSLGSIQRGVERQRKRDEEIRRQLQAGGSVRTEEAQAALGNQPFFEQFKQFGDEITRAATSAFTPIRDQFRTLVGEGIAGELSGLTTKLTESFTSFVTGIVPVFGTLESAFAGTIDRMIQKAETGTSQLGQSITRMVEDNLTRALRDAERRS